MTRVPVPASASSPWYHATKCRCHDFLRFDIIATLPLLHWLQLALTSGLGPVLTRRLVEMTGGPEHACAVSRSDLRRVEGIGDAKSRAIHESLQSAAAEAQ